MDRGMVKNLTFFGRHKWMTLVIAMPISRSEHGLVPPLRALAARMFGSSSVGGCLVGTQTGQMGI